MILGNYENLCKKLDNESKKSQSKSQKLYPPKEEESSSSCNQTGITKKRKKKLKKAGACKTQKDIGTNSTINTVVANSGGIEWNKENLSGNHTS
jgi:hypothetical protein